MRKLFLFAFLLSSLLYCKAVESFDLKHFHVCTVASARTQGLEKLEISCQKHSIHLEVIGLGKPYYGNGTKLLRMMDYVHKLDDNEIVMFVDGYDVIIAGQKEKILEKFLNMNIPFLMSAERNCFPLTELAAEYPDSPTIHRYINTGSFIGYVKNIKQWLLKLQPIDVTVCDQQQTTLHYLNREKLFVLDHYCEIFLPLWNVEEDEISIDKENHLVNFLTTGTTPAVIHANGHSFKIYNKVYGKLIKGKKINKKKA